MRISDWSSNVCSSDRLRTTELHSKYSLPDLAMHEAIPGHAWQGEYAHAMPLIRTMLAFNAYSEGWALYAEQLADELGLYDDFEEIGSASCRARVCQYVLVSGVAVYFKKKHKLI